MLQYGDHTSADLYLEVCQAFNHHSISPYGKALLEPDVSLVEPTLLEILGGSHTQMGQALLDHPDESNRPPEERDETSFTEATATLGGSRTNLGRALLSRENTVNITTQWLDANGVEVTQMLIKHLSIKLKTSRKIHLIEDHVQVFLIRIMERDTLAPYIKSGKNPTFNVLKIWAYQSACTEMRGWGVDADLRTSRGAKTNRDQLVERGKLPAVVIHTGDSVVERRYEIENGEYVGDLYNPHARNVEAELISAETLRASRALIRRKLARTNPHCETLFNAMLEGEKQVDIAEAHGLSRSQAGVLISQIREVLRKGLPMIQA